MLWGKDRGPVTGVKVPKQDYNQIINLLDLPEPQIPHW